MSNPSAKSSLLPSILDRLIEPREEEAAAFVNADVDVAGVGCDQHAV